MTLVDRKGRKFLFILGTSGIIVCLIFVGILFLRTEKNRYDVRDNIQGQVGQDQTLLLHFDRSDAGRKNTDPYIKAAVNELDNAAIRQCERILRSK